MSVTKVAVIGAGSMGSGIAALCASAGMDVVLLDKDAESAQRGIDIQLKRKGFYLPEFAERVRASDDYELLADREWVIEAIFEDLDAKHALYQSIEPHLSPTAIVSSNTSTLPLESLLDGVPESLRERFAITHFFNPPKVMRLVELIASGDTEAVLRTTIEQALGKIALECRDTPGFIANRVGCYWMAAGVSRAREFGVSYELADASFGRAFGIPRTGIFGLLDYIGLQLVEPIWKSLETALPQGDALRDIHLSDDEFIAGLVERGLTGRTGDGGFYRGRDETINSSYDYVPRKQPHDPVVGVKDPRKVMETDSPGGRFARAVFLDTLAYCCNVAPSIADHVGLIDDGLKLGFGWKKGIFELADAIGIDWVLSAYGSNPPELVTAAASANGFYGNGSVLSAKGEVQELPPREGVVTLESLSTDIIVSTDAGKVHAVESGTGRIGIIDLHTPMNSLPAEGLELLRAAVDAVTTENLVALVIGNDKPVFCAGADLGSIAAAGESGSTEQVAKLIKTGAQTMQALKFASVPVVAAVRGVALGGGLEATLSCDRVVAHADARMGFPERNVGLFPGWTGTVSSLQRLKAAGVTDYHQKAFDFIASASNFSSAFEAQKQGFLATDDVVLMSFNHVLARALEEAEKLAPGYSTPADEDIELYSGSTALDSEWPLEGTTDNDHAIVSKLADHYTGSGSLTYSEFCERESEFDIPLVLLPANVERAQHMAATRKPLRN